MALIKPIITPHRAVTKYQRIQKVELDNTKKIVLIVVSMFTDEEARRLNMPLWTDYVEIPFDRIIEDPMVLAYNLLTQLDGIYKDADGDENIKYSELLLPLNKEETNTNIIDSIGIKAAGEIPQNTGSQNNGYTTK